MAIGTYMSIITLCVNGLNTPPKDTDWLKGYKNKTHIYAVYKKNIFHANGKQKKAGVATVRSDKIDLKIKKISRDKEGPYIMIKGSIQEKDITIVNIYDPTQEHLNA